MKNIYRLIRLNRLIRSHRIKFLAAWLADLFHFRYLVVRLDPIMACNLRCHMCYFSNSQFRRENRGLFKESEVARIAAIFFPRTLQLAIGCGAEPTLYKNFTDIVKLARNYKVPNIGFVTNGQVLTESHIKKLVEYGLNELTLSMHGVKKDTYETLMQGASYEKLHDVLTLLSKIKEKERSDFPNLRINYTVNPDNLTELSEFFNVFGRYNIRTLQVRPIVDFKDTVYTKKDLSPFLQKYNETLDCLGIECNKRGIMFLATRMDPTFRSDNPYSVIFEAVLRYISPMVVWRKDFIWQDETYEAFCGRIGWRSSLWRNIFRNIRELEKSSINLTFDVNL